MQEVYREDGSTFFARQIQAKLKPPEVIRVVTSNSVKFALLEIDKKIYLQEPEDVNLFWEQVVKPKLCRTLPKKYFKRLAQIRLSRHDAEECCYFASLWESETSEKIIVLFTSH